MRKQYHFRPSANCYYAWDVDHLVALASGYRTQKVFLLDIAEIDEPFWFNGPDDIPKCREIAGHARLIEQADTGCSVIMSPDRRIMDGMHRVLKALNAGEETVDTVIFDHLPEPDYTDVLPGELPYE